MCSRLAASSMFCSQRHCMSHNSPDIYLTLVLSVTFLYSAYLSQNGHRECSILVLCWSTKTSLLWRFSPKTPFLSVRRLCLHIMSVCTVSSSVWVSFLLMSGGNLLHCSLCLGQIMVFIALPSLYLSEMCSERKQTCIWSLPLGDMVLSLPLMFLVKDILWHTVPTTVDK